MTTYTFTVPVLLTVTVNAAHSEDAAEDAACAVHALNVDLSNMAASAGNDDIVMSDGPYDLTLTDVSPEERD